MNGVMNGIVSGDGEYQAILRKSDIYSGELDRMDLSKEIRLLIDRYVSEQNALGFPDSPICRKTGEACPVFVRLWLIGDMPSVRQAVFNHDLLLQKVRISLIHFPYRRYPSQFPSVFISFISSCAITI